MSNNTCEVPADFKQIITTVKVGTFDHKITTRSVTVPSVYNSRMICSNFQDVSWAMSIIEDGSPVEVGIDSSWYAGIICGYQYAVDRYVITKCPNDLFLFEGKKIRDDKGIYHILDTNPDHIDLMIKQYPEWDCHSEDDQDEA